MEGKTLARSCALVVAGVLAVSAWFGDPRDGPEDKPAPPEIEEVQDQEVEEEVRSEPEKKPAKPEVHPDFLEDFRQALAHLEGQMEELDKALSGVIGRQEDLESFTKDLEEGNLQTRQETRDLAEGLQNALESLRSENYEQKMALKSIEESIQRGEDRTGRMVSDITDLIAGLGDRQEELSSTVSSLERALKEGQNEDSMRDLQKTLATVAQNQENLASKIANLRQEETRERKEVSQKKREIPTDIEQKAKSLGISKEQFIKARERLSKPPNEDDKVKSFWVIEDGRQATSYSKVPVRFVDLGPTVHNWAFWDNGEWNLCPQNLQVRFLD